MHRVVTDAFPRDSDAKNGQFRRNRSRNQGNGLRSEQIHLRISDTRHFRQRKQIDLEPMLRCVPKMGLDEGRDSNGVQKASALYDLIGGEDLERNGVFHGDDGEIRGNDRENSSGSVLQLGEEDHPEVFCAQSSVGQRIGEERFELDDGSVASGEAISGDVRDQIS